MSTKKEQDDLYNTFKALDKNSNGRISKEELIEGFRLIYKEMDDE